MTRHISIVIPVYRNTKLFLHNLAINKPFIESCEIIVVNDYPPNDITAAVQEIIPQSKVILHATTKGFGQTINDGVSRATGQYVMFMNTDVTLNDARFTESVLQFEKSPKLFAVSFAQKDRENNIHGGNKGSFFDGFIRHSGRPANKISPNLWAEGGSMICRRDLFIKFQGFDELYSPFYEEDKDLSYVALKSGYSVFFDPSIVVNHHHGSTIGSYFEKAKIKTIAHRNLFIFHWKNITDTDLFYKHLLAIPKMILSTLLHGDVTLVIGFLQALVRLPVIITKRHNQEKYFIKTDAEVLSQFANEYK